MRLDKLLRRIFLFIGSVYMKTVYSFSELKQSQFSNEPHYLVVGNPISHSLSPVMHQAALDYYNIPATYLALQLEPSSIGSFAAWCNKESFLGCNITIPYKETLLELVDEIDTHAEEVGVINTIERKDGLLKGYNTDVFGFLKPLEEYSEFIEGHRAIVFGTGGASKAIKTGLIQSGIEEIVFVSRNPDKNQVVEDRVFTKTVDYSQWQEFARDASIIINTTPVGMLKSGDNRLVNEQEGALLSGKICYDLVYNPQHTPFLQTASANNATTINGLDMLMYQGSRSFEIWTGKSFPEELIKSTLKKVLYE